MILIYLFTYSFTFLVLVVKSPFFIVKLNLSWIQFLTAQYDIYIICICMYICIYIYIPISFHGISW